MKHQIMTVMLDAFLIINALPPSFCKNASPYFFHGAFAPSFIWSRRPCPHVRRSTFGARAFAIAGPTVWNSLPDSLRDPAVGPDQFRRDLKTHLFE